MYTAKVSTKGWIVIPKDLRKKFGIREGSRVQVVEYGDVLALVPLPEDPITALWGMLEEGPSLTEDLLEAREQEKAREEESCA